MPDGTTTQADAALGSEKAGTPKDTFTKAELDKAVRDGRTAVLADVNRAKKLAEDALTRVNQRLIELEEAEEEAHRDDPESLAAIKARRQQRAKEADLAQKDTELEEAKARLKTLETEKAVTEVATQLGVNPSALAKLAKFTDGSKEAIEEIAAELPKETPGMGTRRPDSNNSRGGGDESLADLVKVNTKGMSLAQLEEHKEKFLAARKREGR